MNAQKQKLSTTLDRIPAGDPSVTPELKVTNKLPKGVTSKELYKDIILIAWPSFVELLLTQLTSMVDMMMVGGIGGEANPQLGVDALTAVGLTTQPKFLLMTAFVAMNTGVTALIARYKGQGDKEKANLVLRQGMMLTFLSTLILSVLGVIFAEPMIIFMGGKGDFIIHQATVYLQIQLAGFATVALTSTITAALRAVGDSRTCMVYNLIANVVNVIFNWLLIGGNLGFPELGVAGASIATVIGQLVAFVIALCVILHGNSFLKLEPKKGFKPNKSTLSNITAIGLPAAAEQLLMRAGMVIFAKTVASLSTTSFATHQVCMNIQALSFMTGQAFAVSATSLVGQSLGRRRPDISILYTRLCITLAIVFSLFFVIFFTVFDEFVIGLYVPDRIAGKTTFDAALTMLYILIASTPINVMHQVYWGTLQGAGDSRFLTFQTFFSLICRTVLFYVLCLPLGFGIVGTLVAIIVDDTIRVTMSHIRFRRGEWKYIRL